MTKTIIKPWNIPRTDLRPRCGKCYHPYKEEKLQKVPELNGFRFPKVCLECKGIILKERLAKKNESRG
jgi:NAD-dependent SIR2 family protein deacetylase